MDSHGDKNYLESLHYSSVRPAFWSPPESQAAAAPLHRNQLYTYAELETCIRPLFRHAFHSNTESKVIQIMKLL